MNDLSPPPPPPRSYGVLWLALAMLLLIAFAVRIFRLDAVAFRGDEGYTVVLWTVRPFTDAWMRLLKGEPAPVGGFTIWWAWAGLIGKSVLGIRLLSVFGNIVGMAVVIALTRRLLKTWRWAFLVALLWLWNPFFLWHAQDARHYGVLSTLTPLSFYLFYRATQKSETITERRGWKPWLPYFFIQLLAIYIYYFEPLFMVAQGLYVLYLRRRDIFLEALRTWIVLLVCSIPVFIQLGWLLGVSNYQGNAETARLTAYFDTFIPTYYFGDNTASVWVGGVVFLFVVSGLGLYFRQDKRVSLFLLLWMIVPAILIYFISLKSAYFRPRYTMMTMPAMLIGTVIAIDQWLLFFKLRQQMVQWVTVVIVLGIGAYSAHEINDYFYHDVSKSPDWVGLTTYLEDHTLKTDAVVSSNPDPTLLYYYTHPGDVRYLSLNDKDYDADVEQLMGDYSGLVLLSGERMGKLEAVLREQWQYIGGDTYPGVTQYRRWDVDAEEIETPLAIQFGDIAILRGISVLGESTDSRIIFLYWEPLSQTTSNYSVLTHIVPASAIDGPLAAGLDHGVANSVISTTQWQSATIYRDPIVIPAEVPTGNYVVRVGLYETASQARVAAENFEGEGNFDLRYPILTIRLTSE